MKNLPPVCGLLIFLFMGLSVTTAAAEPLTADFGQFNTLLTGDWQQYGQLFTNLQHYLFPRLFILIITTIPVLFFLHSIVIGPISIPHKGREIYCYTLFVRIIHWLAALSFCLLLLTAMMIIFARFTGGGEVGILARQVHLLAALLFAGSTFFMFFFWLKDMLPTFYDLKWILILGGYLRKELKPVPAGKFNAGQKMWFWLAVPGGGVMAVTGYLLYSFEAGTVILRIAVIIHNLLGGAMLAMFLVHLYMSTAAIKGALGSMISGYKNEAELKILHARFKY